MEHFYQVMNVDLDHVQIGDIEIFSLKWED